MKSAGGRYSVFVVLAGVCLLALVGAAGAVAAATTIERASVSSTGGQGDNASLPVWIGASGRYLTFTSFATNLVAGDTNGKRDVFLRDLQTGATQRVSLSDTGAQAGDESWGGPVSADGRWVAFQSEADNLISGQAVSGGVFVRDLQNGTNELVHVSSSGEQGIGGSGEPEAMSPNGRYVLLSSYATNLVPGDTNSSADIFLRDRTAGTTERIDVSNSEEQADKGSSGYASLSDDGRFVAFESGSTNLVPGDTNGVFDIFVRDRQAGTTERVSVSSTGAQGNRNSFDPYLSADGRYVAFYSHATNLAAPDQNGTISDVFVHDRETGKTELVSVSEPGALGDGESAIPSISADGRYVVFQSSASNLVTGDTNGVIDIFLRDREAATTRRLSVSAAGAQSDGDSISPVMTADGRYVGFPSGAGNLVAGDTNGVYDVFVVDRGVESPPITFIDIAASPYRPAIEHLAAAGIVSGYPVGDRWEFRPGNALWRAQFAKMIVGALGLTVEESMTSPFTDLGADDLADLYPHEYVAAAYAKHITTGKTATTFGPYLDLTRAQLISMVVRALDQEQPGTLLTPPAGWTGILPASDPTHGVNVAKAEYNGLLAGIALSGWDIWAKAARGETAQVLDTMRSK